MKKRWILLAAILPLLAALLWLRGEEQPLSVAAVEVVSRRVEQTLSCTGVVEVKSGTPIALTIPCVIDEVMVQVGERVATGDVLATIDKEATREVLTDPAQWVALAAMPEKITASADGTVMAVKAVSGQLLEVGTPCAMVAADRDLQIRIAIREKDLKALREGMAVRVTGAGFAKSVYTGVLTSIASSAVTDSGGVVVEGLVKLDDDQFDPSLRLGLTAKATVVTAVEDGLLIPYDAVMTDDTGSFVYAVENECAYRRSVAVVTQVSEGVLLQDAAWLGTVVVRDGRQITEDGQKVMARVVEP